MLPLARADALVREFLAGRKSTTLRAYQKSLEDFARWGRVASVGVAARSLLSCPHGQANRILHAYRSHLLERRASPATVNLRLSAVRALVRLARIQGLVSWHLEVPGVKPEAYRDTRGPGRDGIRAVLERTAVPACARELRDRAILRLLTDLALRRGEVVALDLEDLDLAQATVAVLGKGRRTTVKLTLPEPTREALRRWVGVRGGVAGPLFGNFDPRNPHPGRPPQRLTGTSVHRIVVRLGREAGLQVRLRPHGIRHTAITEALDRAKGDVRAAQKFSRHADPRTLLIYDDAREDVAGEVARRVAAWDPQG